MEFSILYAIQRMRTPLLDPIMVYITGVVGNYGQGWVALSILLLLFRRTRRCGLVMLLSYGLVLAVGQCFLKDLIARARPCHLDESIPLLIDRPGSCSFPSTHSGWAFAAAASVLLYHKRAGIPVVILASVIAFSRLYLFVHFPTDVLFGIALGIAAAFAARFTVEKITAGVRQQLSRHADKTSAESESVPGTTNAA